jgi:DNA-binding MarR family transcriptional regulator
MSGTDERRAAMWAEASPLDHGREARGSSPRGAELKRIPLDAGLGTLLRHLVELLDGDVEAVYREQGLDCRSRFTPVIRHLERDGPSTIRQISSASGLTHSAISQTVREMLKAGLVLSGKGVDARERIIAFTPAGEALLPQLHQLWRAIWAAADGLSEDVGEPLSDILRRAIAEVERRPFRDRITGNIRTDSIRASTPDHSAREMGLSPW